MVMASEDFREVQRKDAATLPPFNNYSVCPCGNRCEIRVHYSPGSRDINGPHFRRICSAYGARWNERAATSVDAAWTAHGREETQRV